MRLTCKTNFGAVTQPELDLDSELYIFVFDNSERHFREFMFGMDF